MPDSPLPSFIKNITEKEPVKIRHNWLYSVLPNRVGIDEEALFLTGYCRSCDNAFAIEIPKSGNRVTIKITKMGIPKWGCVEPDLG